MKTGIILIASLVLIMGINTANAAKYRVNNNATVAADFTSVQVAHDAAVAGDTIYVEGSAVNYGNLTAIKQLYWYGPGYYLTQNDSTQAAPSTATLGYVYFNAGSAGSLLTGFSVSSWIDINESNITIKRNNVTYYAITMGLVSNIMILQNYLVSTTNSSSYSAVMVQSGCTNIIIQNNYLTHTGAASFAIQVQGTSSAQISNNVIDGNISVVNSAFTDNIMKSGTYTGSANSFDNNMCPGTEFPVLNNNLQNINMLTVFDSTQTSTDAIYKLIALSPALGAGITAGDLGMFGGPDPYKVSGLPAIPSIFFYSGPSSGSDASGLPITIKIKSNN